MAIFALAGCTGASFLAQPAEYYLLREAFFTMELPAPRSDYQDTRELGRTVMKFSPDEDDQLVFVAVFNPPRDIHFRGILKDPSGAQRDSFERRVRFDGQLWRAVWQRFSMTRFRRSPGQWRMDVVVNGRLVESVPVVIAPAAASRYGLRIDDAFEAIQRGEAREALAYYEAQGARLERGGLLEKARAARAYRAAVYVAGLIGAYQTSIRLGQRALDLLGQLPQTYEVFTGKADLRLYLGQTHMMIGDSEEAEKQFRTSLDLAQQSSATVDRLMYSALAQTGFAALAFLQEDCATALEQARSAIRSFDEFFTIGGTSVTGETQARQRRILAYALVFAGRCELAAKRFDAAEELFRRALTTSIDLPAREVEVLVRASLADIAIGRGRIADVEEPLRTALAESDRLGLSWVKTLILTRLASVAAESGRHRDAFQTYQEAIRAIEDVRSQLETTSLRMMFVEDKQGIYHGAVRSALHLGSAADAFAIAERSRARAFLDLLGTQTILSSEKAQPLVAEEVRLRAQMIGAQALTAEISGMASASEWSDIPLQARSARDVTVAEHVAFLNRVKKENAEQASLMAVEPLTAEEVQALLPDDAALLEYLVTEGETIVWVIDSTRITVHRLPVTRTALASEVMHLREAVRGKTDVRRVQVLASSLYDLLLKPIRRHVAGSRLLIIPHDVLHYVPFAALRSADGQWLAEEFTLSTAPSASVLKYLRGKGEWASERVLIVGNPINKEAPGLPYAELEARTIAERYPGATLLLREHATESTVKALSSEAGVIHFATHADLRQRDPLSSALLLTPNGKEDGRLDVREIFRLQLNARLVVLSACDTGLGALSKGDELLGLQRAFLYAGTPAVITTLWQVDDRATYVLMREFYRRLDSRGPAEALREAQRATMREFPHPFAWAAFSLTGMPR